MRTRVQRRALAAAMGGSETTQSILESRGPAPVGEGEEYRSSRRRGAAIRPASAGTRRRSARRGALGSVARQVAWWRRRGAARGDRSVPSCLRSAAFAPSARWARSGGAGDGTGATVANPGKVRAPSFGLRLDMLGAARHPHETIRPGGEDGSFAAPPSLGRLVPRSCSGWQILRPRSWPRQTRNLPRRGTGLVARARSRVRRYRSRRSGSLPHAGRTGPRAHGRREGIRCGGRRKSVRSRGSEMAASRPAAEGSGDRLSQAGLRPECLCLL